MHSSIESYINLVRSGTIPVCKEQIQLCALVERVFKQENLMVKENQINKYLGLQEFFPFQLFPWEIFCFVLHNCVYRADGQLRFPDLFIMVGRGAGKNGYLSFEDFCLLTPANGIKYYNIDICANNEEQAKTTFMDIYHVLEENKRALSPHFYWNKEVIRNLETKSELRFRTSNAKTKDGGRPGKVDFDEYHAYENYKSINVFKTGLGKKAFPRTTITTTNGDVRDGPLDRLLTLAESILKGEIEDGGLLPFICRLDDEKEVDNPEMWKKANPSLQYLPVLQEEMRKEYRDYTIDKIGNAAFMTKRMNIPVGDREADVTAWENILAANQPMPDLTGMPCVAGIDYAKTTDFVAAGLLFKKDDIYYWLTHSWVCTNCADLSRIKFSIEKAEKEGLLTIIDAADISPEIPARWIAEQREHYRIVNAGIDMYRHTLMSSALKEAGFYAGKNGNLILVRPLDQGRIAPVISSAFANKKIVWGENSLMNWYTNNAKQVLSTHGNISYEKKEAKSRKTDGFMAFVAAMACSEVLDVYNRAEDRRQSMRALIFD